MEARTRRISRHIALLLLCMLVQGAFCFAWSLSRHAAFKTSGYDIGDFVQVLHNLTHGYGLTTTIAPPYVKQPWLAVHFSPILYLLAPLYALIPCAVTLLFVQCACMALAALPLFAALKRAGCSENQSLALAVLYLINPFVLNASVWDFHEIAFAPLLIATASWALLAKERRWFVLSCVLLALVKEHYGIAVAALGFCWAHRHREWKFGFSVMAAGIALAALVLGAIMPHLSPAAQHFMTAGNSVNNRYGWITQPPLGMTHGRVLLLMLVQNVFYAWLLLFSWLMLPLMAPCWLLPGLADLLANGASLHSIMRSPLAYHNAALIPVLALACGHVMVKRNLSGFVLGMVAAVSLCTAYVFLPAPAPGAANVWELSAPQLSMAQGDRDALADIRALIKDDPIASQNNALAHLAARKEAYHFPETKDEGGARWLVLRLRYPYRAQGDMFGATYSVTPEAFMQAVRHKLDDKAWGIAYFRHGWLVMQRGEPDAKSMPGVRKAVDITLEELAAAHEASVHKGR